MVEKTLKSSSPRSRFERPNRWTRTLLLVVVVAAAAGLPVTAGYDSGDHARHTSNYVRARADLALANSTTDFD